MHQTLIIRNDLTAGGDMPVVNTYTNIIAGIMRCLALNGSHLNIQKIISHYPDMHAAY